MPFWAGQSFDYYASRIASARIWLMREIGWSTVTL